MKLLVLNNVEQQTLREMGIFHSHARTRMRAQAILRLSQGLTLQQTADEFKVHLNSVEQWRQRWSKQGLVGLYEGQHTGRHPKWTPAQQEALRAVVDAEGGTAGALLRRLTSADEGWPTISMDTAKRYLKEMNFRYKRYRYGLKKSVQKKPSGRRPE